MTEDGEKWPMVTTFFLTATAAITGKNLVYKNIKASDRSEIKNILVILLVAFFISFEGFGQKMMFL